MDTSIFRHFFTFVILCLAQALVLNHINLYGCATPLMYIYFIMLFRRGFPRWAVLLWSFFMGLCIDVFSNTPGVAAASATFLGFLQPYLLEIFTPRESPEDLLPTMRSLGTVRFINYNIICTLVYILVFFSIEAFNFFNWQQWLLNIGGSTLLTAVLILVVENVRKR